MRSQAFLRATLGLSMVLGIACEPDTTWRRAYDATEQGWVMNVFGLSSGERYTVGGMLDRGHVTRFDGQTATEETLPEVPLVNWIFGFASDDLHAVGNDGTLLRNDGEGWVVAPSPTDQDLWGVWGAAPNDVWAVGGTARAASGVPTLIHFDGTEWTNVRVPPLAPPAVNALFKIFGTSANDIYAVGDAGVILHFDGTAWSEIPVRAPDDLVAVWGTGPNDILAVGGRSNGVIAYFNGSEWHTDFVTPLPGLNGVWMQAPGVAHVVGLRGTVARFDADTLALTPELVDEALDFHAVFGVDGVLTAVGGNLASPSSPRGIAWQRNLALDE